MRCEPVKRLSVHQECFAERKMMPGSHLQAERNLQLEANSSFPPNRTNIYIY